MRFIVMTFAVLLFGVPGSAQDVEGSQDHPLITRYPGSSIEWYLVENHRPYKLAVGPVTGYKKIDDWIETEGRVTRILYVLNGGQRTETEVYQNYKEALEKAGFEILGEGLALKSSQANEVGGRTWRGIFFAANPWDSSGPVNGMVAGSSTSGGSGTVIARKERAAGTVYVAATTYKFRADRLLTLVDVVEAGQAETGHISVDAEAIGRGIEEEGRVVLDGVLFDFDKATLKPESTPALDQIALFLKANPKKNFFVVGHTDAKGKLDYNQKLSSDRAAAVVAALIKDYGIESSRLDPHGVGPLVPVYANSDDAGREKNRRVELVER